MIETGARLLEVFFNLPTKEKFVLIFLILVPLFVLGFAAGKMYMQYRVEKIDSEKSGLMNQLDLLELRLTAQTDTPIIKASTTSVIHEPPVSIQSHSSIESKEKKKNPHAIISNENNIIFAGMASSEDIDKLALKGRIKIGMVDGMAGKVFIFSNREGDAEKLKLIMEDESKLKVFHRLIYARGSNYKKINIDKAPDFYLHIVNVVEDILK
jgi:hypothetical protein